MVVTPGAWYVELDDGGGADLRTERPGSETLRVGDVIESHGLTWRLVDVQPLPKYARAELVTEITAQSRPPSGRG